MFKVHIVLPVSKEVISLLYPTEADCHKAADNLMSTCYTIEAI